MALTKASYSLVTGAPINVLDYGADASGVADSTSAIQAALNAGTTVYFPAGNYRITSLLTLNSNQTVTLSANTTITQATVDVGVFSATSKTNITIEGNGGMLYNAVGFWSGDWTGTSGHLERGLQFYTCSDVLISNIHIRNFGSAGMWIEGGDRIRINAPVIEGTTGYGTTVDYNTPNEGNFQIGIFLRHSSLGLLTNCSVVSPVISGTGQGVVLEAAQATNGDENITFVGGNIFDIPGQHGFYMQAGCSIVGVSIDNMRLSGIKFQVGDSADQYGFVASGCRVTNCQSNAFEVSGVGSKWMRNVKVDGVAIDCARGIAIAGKVDGGYFNVTSYDATEYGAQISGTGCKNIDLHIQSVNSGEHGVFLVCENGSGIRVWPYVRNPSTSATNTYNGVYIETATTLFDLFDVDVADSGAKMAHGLRATSGLEHRIRNYVRINGGQSYGVRFASVIGEWPTDVKIVNSAEPIFDLNFLQSSQTMVFNTTSTSASNVVLSSTRLPDESAYCCTAEIVGKLANSSERACFISNCLVYRDAGGNATIQGSPTSISSIQSAGFAGAFSWDTSSGTVPNIRVLVNSGGAATYQWQVRLTITKVFN
jgi:hypothetical protein